MESPRGELRHSAPESLSSRQTECWQRAKTSWSVVPLPPCSCFSLSLALFLAHFFALDPALHLYSFFLLPSNRCSFLAGSVALPSLLSLQPPTLRYPLISYYYQLRPRGQPRQISATDSLICHLLGCCLSPLPSLCPL